MVRRPVLLTLIETQLTHFPGSRKIAEKVTDPSGGIVSTAATLNDVALSMCLSSTQRPSGSWCA